MKLAFSSLILVASVLAGTAVHAQGIVSNGTTYLQYVGTPFNTGTGNASLFFGSPSAFATDMLYRDGWAYNQGVGTSNRPLSTLDSPVQTYVGNVATFSWTNAGAGVSGFARWDAVMTTTLTELGANAARVDTSLSFKANAGNSAAIAFSVFRELDLDIIGTGPNNAPSDTYRVLDASAATGIYGRAFDGSASNYAEFVGVGATRYEFTTGSALRTRLGDVSGTGSGALATAAGTSQADWASTDGAVAFQWARTLAPGETFNINSSYTINAALVPEPGSWALMLAGAASLLLLARRRR